jgi:hypothetical protein
VHLQVAVAPPTLVGYLTAGATPVWLLGSFAVLSLLYRAEVSADPAAAAAEPRAERPPASADRLGANGPTVAGRLPLWYEVACPARRLEMNGGSHSPARNLTRRRDRWQGR